jgi:lipid II:glycine glycyltransferase (peptidoglycan interpeptide bridge formation enzyme)
VANPESWDAFAAAHDGHLLQTYTWGKFKSQFGWNSERIAIARNGAIHGGAQILYRQFPFGLTLAYVPRGPVITDPKDPKALAALVDAIREASHAHSAFALKIEPNWPAPFPFPPTDGWRPAACIQPHTTIQVDLTRDLNTILAEMKPKWRYNIRLAERKEITVREGSATDLPMFYELLKLTSARDRFPIHTFAYYRAAFESLLPQDHARLFVAEYANEMIAAIFVTAFAREAIYLYGASGNAHRERMPNHALHWHAIQWAKSRGCTHYDLWGVGATSEAGAGNAHGLYQFKHGFGGHVVEYAGAVDLVFSRWKFAVYQRVLAFRRGTLG